LERFRYTNHLCLYSTTKGANMNPLSSRRYTELADKASYVMTLLARYLELKIEQLEQNKGDK
jgi:hypothetical protein